MPIVSSAYTLGPTQVDGRRYCTERHTDHVGAVHRTDYLSSVGTDYNAVMLARAAAVTSNLQEEELVYAMFVAPAGYTLQWSTVSELSVWARDAYKKATKETLALIARRILEWITSGRLTDTQARGAFGLNASQWNTLKTKMQNLVAGYDAVQASVGE